VSREGERTVCGQDKANLSADDMAVAWDGVERNIVKKKQKGEGKKKRKRIPEERKGRAGK